MKKQREKITTESFIVKAQETHNNKYDYSKTVYTTLKGKVEIICPEHGSFFQRAGSHLNKSGCPECSPRKKLTTEKFIENANKIHNNKYDYSKTIYKNMTTPVIVICPEHGEFLIRPDQHINNKRKCPKCLKRNYLTTETFIQKAKEIHNNKYDYTKTEFKTLEDKIIVICPIHGEFEVFAKVHLKGFNCKKCSDENKRLTTESFIENAAKIYNNKYDYSKTRYRDYNEKVEIICPVHGSFFQTPSAFLQGRGCKRCSKIYKEDFIKNATRVHNYKYDYSKVDYINSGAKVEIICPEHGSFWQVPNKHTKGHGCVDCAGLRKRSKEELIELSNKIHNNKYDYSKVEYTDSKTPVEIICPEHGSFYQIFNNHATGNGCRKCVFTTLESFIEKSNKVHNNKYVYSKVKYSTTLNKVEIICPEHGSFWQIPDSHIKGYGCQDCAGTKRATKEEFIQKANKLYFNKYDYSKTDYINSRTDIIITCRDHGDFITTPGKHLYNQSGCPKCSLEATRSKGEQKIFNYLSKNNIKFKEQYKFEDCKNIFQLPFDFYLPDYKTIIEFDGKQHFEEVSYFGGEETFQKTQINDKIKTDYCINNNIKLIRISYKEFNNIDKIIDKIIE